MRIPKAVSVANGFSPSTPLKDLSKFEGRFRELETCLDALIEPGAHLLIYGARGIGKTTLANVVISEIENISSPVVRYVCSRGDTYRDIFGAYLFYTGDHVESRDSTSKEVVDTSVGAKLPLIRGNTKKIRTIESSHTPHWENELRPNSLVTRYMKGPGIFIVDEFDRVRDTETLTYFSDTLKQLSDLSPEFHFVVLGVADSAQELIGSHRSLNRGPKSVEVGPMAEDSLYQILMKGFSRLGIRSSSALQRYIVTASSGFPFVVHLLGSEVAKETLRSGLDRCGIAELNKILPIVTSKTSSHLVSQFEDYCYQGEIDRQAFAFSRGQKSIIRELVAFAAAGHTPCTAEQIAENATVLVGLILNSARKQTRSKTALSKNWGGLFNLDSVDAEEVANALEEDVAQLFEFRVIKRGPKLLQETRISILDPLQRVYIDLRLAGLLGTTAHSRFRAC